MFIICSEMFVQVVILAAVFPCVVAVGGKWEWKNVAEPQCNNCTCFRGSEIKLKPLRAIFARKRHFLIASKLDLTNMHLVLFKGGLIKTDKDLDGISTFTIETHLSRNMKKLHANWTLGETSSGRMFKRIRRNIMVHMYEAGTSKKIRKLEDSLIGDGVRDSKVIWADETNILVVSCFGSEGYSAKGLFSTSRTLSRTTMKIVLDQISARGFNRKRAVLLDYRV